MSGTAGSGWIREPDRPLTFRGGPAWLLAFLVAGSLVVIARRYANYVWELGPTIPIVGDHLGSAVLALVLLGLAVAVVRIEQVALADLGLAPALFLPGAVAIGAYYVALNAVTAGIALAAGVPSAVGYQWSVPPAEAVVVFVYMAVLAGLVEELVFRGYLQNRFVAMAPGDRRVRVAVGILIASALFAAYHVPRVLTGGLPAGMEASGYLGLLFVNGIGFGLLYEFTQNLYVPILVHAAGNMPGTAGIIFFDVGPLPAWATALYAAAYLGLIVAVVLAYRRWAIQAGLMPVWDGRHASTLNGQRPAGV